MEYPTPYSVDYLEVNNVMYPVFRDLLGNIISYEDFEVLTTKGKAFYENPASKDIIEEKNKLTRLIFQLKLRYGTMKGDDDYSPYKSLYKLKYPEPLYEYLEFKKKCS